MTLYRFLNGIRNYEELLDLQKSLISAWLSTREKCDVDMKLLGEHHGRPFGRGRSRLENKVLLNLQKDNLWRYILMASPYTLK
jgi:hypothetical protein